MNAEETAAAVAAQGALPVPVGDQPQPLDDTRLAEIAARVQAAHPGPWRRSDDEGSLERYVLSEDDLFAVSFGYRGNNTQAEADFIAHAREDVPTLLAEVERLKAQRTFLLNQLRIKDARSGDADRALCQFLGSDDANPTEEAAS